MKLLLDQNLSQYLLDSLCKIWDASTHVNKLGMTRANDREIWDYARKNAFVLLSKDNDFVQMATLFGAPPKVILLATGNASTDSIRHYIITRQKVINEFYHNPLEALLII